MPNTYVNKVKLADGTTLIDISDTTAVAADVKSGTYFYTAAGQRVEGTASGGGGVVITDTTDAAGGTIRTITATNASGGGGLIYESGTWTPASDVAHPTISFSDTHTEAPLYVEISDTSDPSTCETYSNYEWFFVDTYKMSGEGFIFSSSQRKYGNWGFVSTGSSTSTSLSTYQFFYSSDNSGDSTTGYPRYFVKETGFSPYANSDSKYFRSGHTFKWIAVWKPT